MVTKAGSCYIPTRSLLHHKLKSLAKAQGMRTSGFAADLLLRALAGESPCWHGEYDAPGHLE